MKKMARLAKAALNSPSRGKVAAGGMPENSINTMARLAKAGLNSPSPNRPKMSMPENPINTTRGSDFKQGSGDRFSDKGFKSMISKLGVSNQPTAPSPQNSTTTSPIGPRPMKKSGKVKKMASGGLAAGHKSADGIASKGKTKAKQIVMKSGGKVC